MRKVAEAKAGEYFGQLALLDAREGTRKARITCTENCHFAVMKAKDYKQSFFKIETRRTNYLIEFFMSLPFFQNLKQVAFFRRLVQCFNRKIFHRGEVVVKEGFFESSKTKGRKGDDSARTPKSRPQSAAFKKDAKEEKDEKEGLQDQIFFVLSGDFKAT